MQETPIIMMFQSSSGPHDVFVELGFIPDYVEAIIAVGATAPDRLQWANNSTFPSGWAAGTVLLDDGADGVTELVTTQISPYEGGDTIATAETANTDGKHVDINGAPAAAGHLTAPGIKIESTSQVASGWNLIKAYRKGW